MGDGTSELVDDATPGGIADPPTDPVVDDRAGEEAPRNRAPRDHRRAEDVGRRRFRLAAVVAIVLTGIPFLWILWGPWATPSPMRTLYEDNFYDLQTRAMFHGHLWLANGAIGIEAFVHGGHQYTYFGLFPSLVRMPIMLVTSSLDGRLTAPMMLLAWLVTGLFVSLLVWRIRVIVRGSAMVSRMEATALGVLVATCMGGTVLMYLGSTPFVFNEDIYWSICLTVGSIFTLLGVLEHPTWYRVIASFVLVMAANLDRATTGWACVVGAVLIAGWFGLGRNGQEDRRWCLPMVGVGLVPLVISCAVNYSKFGVLFGVSNLEQVWTHVNAYRRKFLAANHGAEEGLVFVPTNVLAYLRPDGLRFTSAFPFITLPAGPPPALGGVLFDRRYRTASLVATTPLLCLLSVWGLVTAFRPKPIGKVALTRILLLAAGSAGAALLLWGYIAPRYLGDFVPFLILASSVAMIDIWRRLDNRKRSLRIGALAIITVAALFSIAANIGTSITPSEEWNTTQVFHYVQAQKDVSDLTGASLRSNVVQGSSLPPWGPADQLYIVGDCDGLYISNGEDYSTVPSQQFSRTTWMTVELGHTFQHAFRVTFRPPVSGPSATLPLVQVGARQVGVRVESTANPNKLRVTVGLFGSTYGANVDVDTGSTHQLVVTTDPAKRLVEVVMGQKPIFSAYVLVGQPIASEVTGAGSGGGSAPIVATDVTASLPQPTLCRSLLDK